MSSTAKDATAASSNSTEGGAADSGDSIKAPAPQQQEPKNVQELTNYIQNMLQQMQDRFQTMSDQIIARIDDMGSRIDDLEHNINDLMVQAATGGDGTANAAITDATGSK